MATGESLVKRSMKAALAGALVVGVLYAAFTMIWHITSQQEVPFGVVAYVTGISFLTCSIPALLVFLPSFALVAYILEGQDGSSQAHPDPPL